MKKERKIFLDELPRKTEKIIDWNNSIGMPISGIYDDLEFTVKIKDYNPKTSILDVEYKDSIYSIHTGGFKNCRLGIMLGKIVKDFKIEIGQVLKDRKRDLVVIDRIYKKDKKGHNRKYYKYKCNKCGYIGEMIEQSIHKAKNGCASCARQIVTPMNNIWNNQRWMCDLGLSEEDAKSNVKGSKKKVVVVCPNCGINREVRISHMYLHKSIFCPCGDGFSYPEKFMANMLNQLNIDFIMQLSCRNIEWCQDKRYDFYIPEYNMIIETHGMQHYEESRRKGSRTLKEEQENDRIKKELALKNGISDYIVIDCRYSNFKFIRKNILESELFNIFDLSDVNWIKCEEFALSSLIREVCEYYNEHEYMTTKEIGDIFGITKETTRKYLVNGTELKWCSYDVDKGVEKARQKSIETNRKALSKEVAVIKDDEEIMRFSSLRELNDCSLEKLGIKLSSSQVCIRLNPEHKKYGELYKGFTFKYVKDVA